MIAAVAFLGFLLFKCSGDKTLSQAPKKLPQAYIDLAKHVALEMHSTPDAFRNDMGIAEIMAEWHAAVMDLRRIDTTDSDIRYIRDQMASAYSEALTRLQRINELPKPPGGGELFVSSFFDGFFGNIFGIYKRWGDAEDKQNAIIAEVYLLIAAIDKADAAQQILPKVAEQYSASFTDPSNRIAVDFDESWASWGPYDWFCIYNAGATLSNSTIKVTMTGASGEKRTNVHFVPVWPKGSWMYARYEAGEKMLDRTVGRQTVVNVQKIDVSLYSPDFSTLVAYTYQGAEKDKDIKKRCEALKFYGRYQPFESGFFWDTQRGAEFTLNGVAYLSRCRAHVTFRQGSQSKTWYWDFDKWEGGETKTFKTKKGDLTFDPSQIDLTLSFPGTEYKHSVTLNIK